MDPSPRADRFALLPGVDVLRRPDGTVQIGTEPPRWLVLHRPPPAAEELLRALDGSRPLPDLCRRTGHDPELWTDLVAELCAHGLAESVEGALPPRPLPRGPEAERFSATLRWGLRRARRALTARSDAAVALVGAHGVHQRLLDLLPDVGVGRVRTVEPPSVPDPRAGRAPWWSIHDDELGPRPPDLVVICDRPLPPWAAADLHRAEIAQLSVRVHPFGGTVGPMTLPGRSACPRCLTRHRSGVDDGWPVVELGRDRAVSAASALTETVCAALACRQVLTLLDGDQEPETVDGTLEWSLDSWEHRRRSWSLRSDCECRRSA